MELRGDSERKRGAKRTATERVTQFQGHGLRKKDMKRTDSERDKRGT